MKYFFAILAFSFAFPAFPAGTFSLIEINPLHGNSPLTVLSDSAKTFYGAGELTGFTEMNGKMYFAAQSTSGDDELWVTDGTLQGTALVKSINPGQGAGIGNLVNVNGHILFMATDNGSDWDLWSTDGTDTGTVKIDELNASSNTALGPYNVSLIGNRLVFCAQQKLLVTDGTASGTDSLLSIANYSQGFGYCELNNFVYFVLPEIGGGDEIWRSDGSIAGTTQVLDLDSAPYNITTANDLVSFNGQMYLSATASGQSLPALYTFDGAINAPLTRIATGTTGNASPQGLKLFNEGLYFIATDSISSNVYRMPIDSPEPVPLIPVSNLRSLSNLSFANNTLYCMDTGNNQIHAVALSGYTYSALSLQGYRLPAYVYQKAAFLAGLGQQIFFEAYDSANGNEVLMQSDLTNAGTMVLSPAGANINHPFNSLVRSGNIDDIFDLQMWGSNIIMPANFTDAGRELWIYNTGIADEIAGVQDKDLFAIYPNPTSDEINICTTSYGNGEQKISITNTEGQVVIQQILSGENTTVKLAPLSTGDYFVTLTENGRVVNTKELTVQK